MPHRHSLARAIRSALILGTVLGAAPLLAQNPAPAAQSAQPAVLDAIQVTGTRIVAPGIVASSPVTEVTAEDLEIRQVVAIEDFLRELPALVPAIGPGTNNGSGGGATSTCAASAPTAPSCWSTAAA